MKLIIEKEVKEIPENFTGIVEYNGDKYWYRNGKRHREDGPAIEWADGSKFWYLNGKCHRESGPAIEYADGSKCWFRNGKLHREDGPACEYADGTKYWYLNGIFYTESAYKAEIFKRSTPNPYNGKIVEIDGKKYQLTAI